MTALLAYLEASEANLKQQHEQLERDLWRVQGGMEVLSSVLAKVREEQAAEQSEESEGGQT